MKKLLVMVLSLVMAVALVGCAKEADAPKANEDNKEAVSEEASKEASEAEEAESEAPVATERTVAFDFSGETKEVVIPAELERVVVIGFDVLDIIDALGYKDKVVGVVDPSSPIFPTYLEGYEGVQSVGSLRGDDLEAIAALKPDAIIGGARTRKAYDSLNEIAPTVWFAIPGMGSGYEEKLTSNIELLGTMFSAEERAAELVADVQAKLQTLKDEVAAIENKSALFLSITGKEISVYSDDVESRYGFVFNEFGFETPASLEEIENDAATHGNSISYEFISSKNPNYLIVLDRGASTGETDIVASDTLDNPLVAATDAVKNDNVLYLDGTSWYLGTGGYEGTLIMIDNLLEQLK